METCEAGVTQETPWLLPPYVTLLCVCCVHSMGRNLKSGFLDLAGRHCPGLLCGAIRLETM